LKELAKVWSFPNIYLYLFIPSFNNFCDCRLISSFYCKEEIKYTKYSLMISELNLYVHICRWNKYSEIFYQQPFISNNRTLNRTSYIRNWSSCPFSTVCLASVTYIRLYLKFYAMNKSFCVISEFVGTKKLNIFLSDLSILTHIDTSRNTDIVASIA
jgi:hypothetical protein